jgi:alkylation response protein AidB-like acyl-CoA dehydrogenase
MDFTFDEDQLLAAQTLRDLLADHCKGGDLRAAADAGSDDDFARICAPRTARLAELGLAGALVPVDQGGLGLSATDFVLLAEESGRAALPEPLVAAAGVAHPLLALLAEQAEGEGRSRSGSALESALAGTTLVLAVAPGVETVASVAFADHVLAGRSIDELALFNAKDIAVAPRESVDPLRRLGTVDIGAATPVAVLRGAGAEAAWTTAHLLGTIFDAAQLVGLAARMNEIAVAYALERKQFGKAIGSNQAVKHLLADVMVKLEFARPVVYAAAATLAPLRVAHAAVAAADAADRAARTAIQIHGAMGYSWEVDLQFYAKRAWALAGLNGGRARHFRTVHDGLLGGLCVLGPDRLFDLPQHSPLAARGDSRS